MRINYTKIINFRLSLALQPKFLLGGPPKGKVRARFAAACRVNESDRQYNGCLTDFLRRRRSTLQRELSELDVPVLPDSQ